MMEALNQQDLTFLFLGVVAGLLASSVALFWSLEDQRSKRQPVKQRTRRF